MNYWEKKANGWVFISHASEDYEDVRVVRNYLEDRGFSVLLFYLKSLEDKSKKKYIKQLIGWEISSRNIFVLCDSKFAKNSKWVEWERSYVQSLPNKIYKIVDIEGVRKGTDSELAKLDDIVVKGTLYLTYSYKDRKRVRKIYNQLNSIGYKVYDGATSLGQELFSDDKMHDALKETVNKGAVIMFLSNNAKKSKWFWKEKSRALHSRAFIIPIIIDDVEISDFPAFRNKQYIDAREGAKSDTIQKIEEAIIKANR